MVLPASSIARARVRWYGDLVEVSVNDDGQWTVPAEHPRLSEHLGEFYAGDIMFFRMPGRVEGEPAHDFLEWVVGREGGVMLTRKLPIPPAEPGVVY